MQKAKESDILPQLNFSAQMGLTVAKKKKIWGIVVEQFPETIRNNVSTITQDVTGLECCNEFSWRRTVNSRNCGGLHSNGLSFSKIKISFQIIAKTGQL